MPTFQPIPAYSCIFPHIDAYSILFQLIPAYPNLFKHILVHSNLYQPLSAYSGVFQITTAYSSLCQHVTAYFPIPNLQPQIINLQFEMPKISIYHRLGIFSVSSILKIILSSFRKGDTVEFNVDCLADQES